MPSIGALTLGSHSIGVVLSKTCLTILSANLSTTCPSYEVLRQLDNSNLYMSGDFVYKNNILQREEPKFKNSWNYYAYDESDTWRIFVDPPREYLSRIKLITIENNFDVYIDRADRKIINNTVIEYHDRYINNCWASTVNSDYWETLIPDTIFYMRNGCKGFTSFTERVEIYLEPTEQDYTTSYKYQYDQWLKNVTENCIYEYGKC